MAYISTLLFLISCICLVVGLIRPRVFGRLFQGKATRKQIGLMFGMMIFVSLVLVGASPAPEGYEEQSNEPKAEEVVIPETEVANSEPEDVKPEEVQEENTPVEPNLPAPVAIPKNTSVTEPEVKPEPKEEQNQVRDLFQVTEVVDGDTIKVSLLGTLRLIGIDTPETRDPRKPVQCFGREASNRAKELLGGKRVYLEYDPANKIDKYGRTLAYVYREDGLFYNAEMIKQGYAHSYVQFPHPRLDEFNAYQSEARENGRGFWAANTCNGDTTKSASSSKPKSTTPLPISPEINKDGFIEGTCASLKKLGLGNFREGDPNYTKSRDGDGDGVACEMN
jgi:endonuclease YncB( thermonuclease family)